MANTLTARKWTRLLIASATVIIILAVVVAGVAWSARGSGAGPSATTSVSRSTAQTSTTLPMPTASVASDATFLSDVTEVDPALVTYEKNSGNVALRSLLTDGSAFCSFLRRDKDMDTAMVSVVVGARHVESQTHLPLNVTTFNAVDAMALITLCPSLQSFVPASDLTKIRALGAALAQPSN